MNSGIFVIVQESEKLYFVSLGNNKLVYFGPIFRSNVVDLAMTQETNKLK